MKTKNIEIQTKVDFSDPVKEITRVPRPIVAMAKDFPNGHLIPFHQHDSSQLLYASAGVMTVTTLKGIWVVPPLRAVWVPALTDHQIGCSGNLSMRILYIKPETASKLPKECCVVSVPPLLRELILHAVTLPRLYGSWGTFLIFVTYVFDIFLSLLLIAEVDTPVCRATSIASHYTSLSTPTPTLNTPCSQASADSLRAIPPGPHLLPHIYSGHTLH